jgi:hypothetical protein
MTETTPGVMIPADTVSRFRELNTSRLAGLQAGNDASDENDQATAEDHWTIADDDAHDIAHVLARFLDPASVLNVDLAEDDDGRWHAYVSVTDANSDLAPHTPEAARLAIVRKALREVSVDFCDSDMDEHTTIFHYIETQNEEETT